MLCGLLQTRELDLLMLVEGEGPVMLFTQGAGGEVKAMCE